MLYVLDWYVVCTQGFIEKKPQGGGGGGQK